MNGEPDIIAATRIFREYITQRTEYVDGSIAVYIAGHRKSVEHPPCGVTLKFNADGTLRGLA